MEPSVILGADLGIRLDTLIEDRRVGLEWLLTAISKPWKNNPQTVVEGYHEENGYLWIPRQFGLAQGFVPDQDRRALGAPQDLELKAKLDPVRGQVEAVPAMVKFIRENGAGLLVAPTGCGKTLLSYAIGAHFHTSLGVFIYAGHMLDNWIGQAEFALGIKPEDVGLVQQDRCDLGKPITIMSIQSLLARRYPDALYNQIGFLICDEVNRFGAAEWNKCIRQFPGKYRLGVSADPSRPDGLEKVITWNLGTIGYTIQKRTVILTIVRIQTDIDYPENSYKDFTLTEERGEFVADALRYDKKLASDEKRNREIIEQLIKARKKGRRVIVFSRLRDHLDLLYQMWGNEFESEFSEDRGYPRTTADFLVGGLKKKERERAMSADIKFATYGFCRDAMNDPTMDTVFFCTPPGNPLQPAGRLRDKGPVDRQPLMILDFTENTRASIETWDKRLRTYERLGFTVVTVKRNVR